MSTWPNRGCLRRPLRGAGIMKAEQQEEKSDHPGLTQANRPPRNPVRFRESFVSPTGVAVNLIELAGNLIRRNLTDGSPAQPLINAYAQGVVLGYYQVKRVGITLESDGTNFWKPCELESIHEIGLEHGRRIREKNDATRARGTTAHLRESRSILSTASKLDAAKVWSYVFSGCAAAGIILFLLFG